MKVVISKIAGMIVGTGASSLSLVAKGASASYHHLSEFWRSKLDDQLGVRRMEMKFEEHLRLISDIESWDPLKTEATFEKSSP